MSARVSPVEVKWKDDRSMRAWFEQYLNSERPFLLAFADDGVIWGLKVENRLITGADADQFVLPTLDGRTLQQAYIFGKEDEIRLFHNELGKWVALQVSDGADFILESQILWGDEARKESHHGFTWVHDNTKGIPDLLVPLSVKQLTPEQCIRLDIHHNVDIDRETGETFISLSRLAGLRVGYRVEVEK